MTDDRESSAGNPATKWPVSRALFQAARMHRLVVGILLRDSGLYAGQEILLMELWNRGPLRPADLIAALGLDASTVTRSLQRLEQAGLIERERSESDRRSIIIRTTIAGEALRDQVTEAWDVLEAGAVVGLGTPEAEVLVACLERITRNLTAAHSELTGTD